MPTGDVETYYEDEQRKHKHEGAGRAFSTAATNEEAVAAGREIAQRDKVEHIIKNQDGKIAERNTYGHDPRTIPG